ncbi:MAG: NADPH-dependent F420 reductase [Anaerolineae bacterium]|nr:NADPH-dependent F420 reductase [Anaerolineae bacterium]
MTEQYDAPLVKTIAMLGGTGKEGSALAMRWALNGYKVIIGSRRQEKAETVAGELNHEMGGDYVTGLDNASAAAAAEIVVSQCPLRGTPLTLEAVIEQIQGKILVDVTVPLKPPKVAIVNVPEGLSAAQEAQAFVGDDVRVVSAFQNVSYVKLRDPKANVACDVLITGNDKAAKQDVIALVEAAGMRGIDAGSLANAIVAEALTSVLVYINKQYKIKHAGIHITGIE